jgi:hypothetical protein
MVLKYPIRLDSCLAQILSRAFLYTVVDMLVTAMKPSVHMSRYGSRRRGYHPLDPNNVILAMDLTSTSLR